MFHCPTDLKVQPYEAIFGQDLKTWTWDELTEDREQDEVKDWAKELNGMRYEGRPKEKFYHEVLLQKGDANMAKAQKQMRSICEAKSLHHLLQEIQRKIGTMAPKSGQAVQVTWTSNEKGRLQDLRDALPEGSLSMGRLNRVLMMREQPAYDILDWLLEGKGNGGTPRTLNSPLSKAKKLRVQEQKKEKEQEKKQEKEKGEKEKKTLKEEVSDLEKHRALLKKRLRDATLKIPNPSPFDQCGYDRVAVLVTAGEVRSMKAEAEDRPLPVIKLRDSWTNLPIMGSVNPEDREDHRAVEFKPPPAMALEPGQEGV